MTLHRPAANNTTELNFVEFAVSIASESEVLVMFVTVDGKVTASNISEWHKIL